MKPTCRSAPSPLILPAGFWTRLGADQPAGIALHTRALRWLFPLITLVATCLAAAAETAKARPTQDRALQPISDQAGLPRVLLIGDSISIGYTLPVRELLRGQANVHRVPGNASSSGYGLQNLDRWLGEGKWDMIHFNFGIHDAKLPPEGIRHASVDLYAQNLRQIVARLKRTGARLIWASSTPIPLGGNLRPNRRFADIDAYNQAAKAIMIEEGIAINDLNAAITPQAASLWVPRDLHFIPEGYALLARQVAAAVSAALPIRFFVDPAAEPAQAAEGRFTTLAAARDHVRSLPTAQRQGRIEIRLRPGAHLLTEPVVFGMADTPPAPGRLVICSDGPQPAILRGSVPVTGWKRLETPHPELPTAAVSQVWVAPLPPAVSGKVFALFGPDGRLPRARSGQVQIFGKPADFTGKWDPRQQFSFKHGLVRPWSNFRDVELAIVPGRQFMMNKLELDSLDEAQSVVRTQLPGSFQLIPYTGGLPETCWFENSLAFLDSPGEWVSDSAQRRLYLWPRSPRDLQEIRAAATVELIRVEGDIRPFATDTPVRGLEFRHLVFTESNRYLWHDRTAGLQHDFELHDAPNAMLRFRGAADCVVEDCEFVDSGATGLRLDLFAQDLRVIGNRFTRLGGGGIVIAGYGPGTKHVSARNEIAHNALSHIGEDYRVSPAIMIFQSAANRVHHNLVHDVPYMGIVLSGAWPGDWRRGDSRERARTIRREETQAEFDAAYREMTRDAKRGDTFLQERILPFLHSRDNLIERNDVFAYMLKQGDGNAIYVAGNGPGNIVRENYVHDTLSPTASYAIRTDDLQSDTRVVGNLIVNVACGGLTLKHVNAFDGNILVNLRHSEKIVHSYVLIQRGPSRGASLSNNVFWHEQPAGEEAPPVWFVENRGGGAAAATLEDLAMDGNLYWTPRFPEQAREALAQLRARGKDPNGIASDPRFRDSANGDYRFADNSPMKARGLTGLHVDETGPQGGWRERFYGRLRSTIVPAASVIRGDAPVRVVATANDPSAILCYTLDHSEPTERSPVFAPTVFREAATLRLRAFRPGQTDTHGALAAIYHDSPGYIWDLGDVPIGSIPPPPLKIRGDVELVKDPTEDRVIRLMSSGNDSPDYAGQLAIARAMRRGRLELTLRFRAAATTAGTLEVLSAFVHKAAVRFRLERGALLVPGSTAPQPLPTNTWVDARIEVDLTNAVWSARVTHEGKTIIDLEKVKSPDGSLSSVDWFGWTMDAKTRSTMEFARFDLKRLGD